MISAKSRRVVRVGELVAQLFSIPAVIVIRLGCLLYQVVQFLVRLLELEVVHESPLRVFVTGCDSGFGRMFVQSLSRREGVITYAGCYTDASVDSLQRADRRVRPVKIDISNDANVQEALLHVRKDLQKDGSQLWALVNNAAMFGRPGRFYWLSSEDYLEPLNINCVGQIRVIKAFLPLLAASKGRIVNVESLICHMPFPDSMAYNISKAAFAAFTQTMRIEVAPLGIKVISIIPGFFKSGVTQSACDGFIRTFKSLPGERREAYPENYEDLKRRYITKGLGLMKFGSEVQDVIDVYEDAVLSRFPLESYWVGPSAPFMGTIVPSLPEFHRLLFGTSRMVLADPDLEFHDFL